MTTITIKEFLSNPKDYLDMVETAPLLLTGKKNLTFQITVIEDDDKFEEKYKDQIFEGIRQLDSGETVTIGDGSFEDFKKFCKE